MTRAETLAAIKQDYHPADDLFCDCEEVPHCQSCTVLWLLQEIEYLNARLDVTATALEKELASHICQEDGWLE